ncbi:MAG: hypothetical protein M3123_04220, partial [Actinomycetota bacterium]|nr:hypothetical protein [Actinomycetota bacterium]
MKIVATAPVAPPAPELLAELAEIVVAPADDEATLIPLVRDAVALIVRGGCPIGGRLLDAAPSLRVIARTGIGVDLVDLEAANRRRIPVLVTPGAGAQAVAEGALALMLALAKRLPELNALVRQGRFRERDSAEIGDLWGATLG